MVRTPVLVLAMVAVAGLCASHAHLAEPVPAVVPAVDLVGVYVCDGINPQGRPYRGIVEIVKTDETFRLKWTFPQSDDTALGIGIVSNGVLAVSYYGGALVGVVVYKIDEGRKMFGEWTVAGANGGVFKETLTKLPGYGQLPDDRDHRPRDHPQKPPLRGDPSKLVEG